jgi:hypothetical protein
MTSQAKRPISMKWLFLILPLVALAALYTLNRNRFCIPEGRFTPDSVFFDNAIASELEFLQRRQEIAQVKVLPYASKEEFLRENPNCCRILSGKEELPAFRTFGGIFAVLVGDYSAAVELNYKLRIPQKDKSVFELLTTARRIMAPCGREVDDELGGTYSEIYAYKKERNIP